MDAIPTKSMGIWFRSRLEARWANFFELIGWGWDYEPFDLLDYVPDFVVEYDEMMVPYAGSLRPAGWIVAPATNRSAKTVRTRRLVEVKPEIDPAMLLPHGEKIDKSGWEGPASIVGATLVERGPHGLEMGVHRYDHRPLSANWWHNWGGPWVMAQRERAMLAWREAGNRVQWRGVAAEPDEPAEVGQAAE